MSWRNIRWITKQYPSCEPIGLNSGVLVFKDPTKFVFISEAIYQMKCYQGSVPMMGTSTGKIANVPVSNLPIITNSWEDFTTNDNRGTFNYSIVPIIYSISALAVTTWFLTLFVVTSYTIKPSFLLKSSTILSSIFLLIVFIKAIIDTHHQQLEGYLFGPALLDSINGSLYLNIIDLIVVILLQINQVQVIMRLFSRQSDKRMTLVIGLTASLTSQIIWAIAKFYTFETGSEAGDILPTFIYLTRTAMAICYAALVSIFLIMKINYIIANKQIWLLTIFTFVLIYVPVAFFVADVANAFIYELSEIFSVVSYVVCVVIPWEWCNKFNLIMKVKEKEGVLGRRFYEDEIYQLDGLELFMEESEVSGDEGDEDDITHDRRKGGKYVSIGANKKEPSLMDKTKKYLLDFTDMVIATGFAIPRPSSAPSASHAPPASTVQPPNLTSPEDNPSEPNEEYQRGLDQHARTRRDIFVYSTKKVTLNFSDNEL